MHHRGVSSSGIAGAVSHATGQTASRDCVLGAKRERLSSRFVTLPQASMARISTNPSGIAPPKFSHSPSGSVRSRLLPGRFKKGCWYSSRLLPGRPRIHASRP